jgi:transposase
VTKKNILFLGSDAGGERAAIIYTIAETASSTATTPRHTSPPCSTALPKGHLASTIDDLLPWNLTQANQAVVVG